MRSSGRIVVFAAVLAAAVAARPAAVSPAAGPPEARRQTGSAAVTAQAATSRTALLVSTAWLADHLHDRDLVLLHVGDKAQYPAQHLPGARLVNFSEDLAENRDGLHLQMLAPDVLRDRLAALGITNASRVVVYAAQNWASPSTRVIFTLTHAGLGARTMLLDGGLDQWVREKRATTDVVPPAATPGALTIAPAADIVDAAFVLAHARTPGYAVVDGRAASFYTGADVANGRKGHIAGALSVPFTSVNDDAGMLKSPAELAALFEKAGVKPGDTVVGYCHVGQQTTLMLFAARSIGHPVLLYDGSFEDWAKHADYPVEVPGGGGGTR